MNQMEIIEVASEYTISGIRDTSIIESELIISDSYNLYAIGGFSNRHEILNIVGELMASKEKLPTSEDIIEDVWGYNDKLITEWAFTRITEDYTEEDFKNFTRDDIESLVADYENNFMDYLSYNGHLDDSYAVARCLEEEKISCVCSIDDDCVYEVIFPRDGEDEVTLNHCQMVMFDSIFDYQLGQGEIGVYNMGSKYIHLLNG